MAYDNNNRQGGYNNNRGGYNGGQGGYQKKPWQGGQGGGQGGGGRPANNGYMKNPLSGFALYSEEKMSGANSRARLVLDAMNGNFRIKVIDGKPTPEGQRFTPWIEAKLGGIPWVTFLGALEEVTLSREEEVKPIRIDIMEAAPFQQGQQRQPPKLQCSIWVGRNRNGIIFLAVEEPGNQEKPQFQLHPSMWAKIDGNANYDAARISRMVARGLLLYLPAISASVSVATFPGQNAGKGVGGGGGGDNFGRSNYQKKPYQGNNQGGGGYNGNNQNGGQRYNNNNNYQRQPQQQSAPAQQAPQQASTPADVPDQLDF